MDKSIHIKDSSGFALFEILIALALFVSLLVGASLLFHGNRQLVVSTLASQDAAFRARTGIEGVRLIRDRDWTLLTDGTHGLDFLNDQWELLASPSIKDGYTTSVIISTDSTNGIKNVSVSLDWTYGQNAKNVTFVQKLGPLEQGIFGDWSNPCLLSSTNAGSGSKGSDVIYSDQKAYVTSNATSAGKKDLFIFDVADPKNPFILSELQIEQGLESVAVAGNYAYVIETDSTDFFVVDISDPVNPFEVSKINLGGTEGQYVTTRINDYVYATAASSSADEFIVVDVADPYNPFVAHSVDIGAEVREVSVLRDMAYLATTKSDEELILVDITDPLSAYIRSSMDLPGDNVGDAIHAKTLARIYIGKDDGSSHELFVVDARDPDNLVLRGSTDSTSIKTLINTSTLGFIGSDRPNKEFQVYDVKDPTNMIEIGSLNLGNILTGIDYYNNLVYASMQNSDILQIIGASTSNGCGGYGP